MMYCCIFGFGVEMESNLDSSTRRKAQETPLLYRKNDERWNVKGSPAVSGMWQVCYVNRSIVGRSLPFLILIAFHLPFSFSNHISELALCASLTLFNAQ